VPLDRLESGVVSAVGNVLIVGGGIAGMTLAIQLKKAGIDAEIVELSTDWTVIGVGISMQGPAMRALKTVGVLDRIIDRGFGYSFFNACDADGNVTATVDLPSLNGPDYPATMGIMRQALHEALKEGVAEHGARTRLGITVATLTDTGDGVEVAFSDGSTGSYDLVVGADGANSKIRDMVFGAHAKGAYTGQAVWRATVSRPPDVLGRHSYFGPRNKAGFNPVSQELMYIYLVQNLPQWTRLPDHRLPEVMRDLLADFGGHLAAARDEITDPQEIVYRPIISLILPSPWYRGRVLLIGDAAHTTTPHMAAGAGLAVEDSVVLAELLDSDRPLADVLEEFMARRYERCRMTVENSYQLGEWEKTPDAPDADPVGVFDRSIRMLAQPI
jgi:2-polyprenyl-6-methoxyphenol hydroxylase-like FAD-dependent oxidoreductase